MDKAKLTRRNKEILELYYQLYNQGQGHEKRRIAELLNISQNTVEKSLAVGRDHFGVHTSYQAARQQHEKTAPEHFGLSIFFRDFENPDYRITPNPWIKINHSFPKIGYRGVTNDEKQMVTDIIRQHYTEFNYNFDLTIVDEVAGSDNYRLDFPDNIDPFLMRINRRITNEKVIRELHDIQKHIYDKNIFSETFNKCLIPVPPTTNNHSSSYIKETRHNKIVEIYPYANNVKHYAGNRDQVQNLAKTYGQVQKALQELNINLLKDLECILPSKPYVYWLVGDDGDIKKHFDNICNVSELASSSNPKDRFYSLFNENRQLINQIWDELQDYIANPPSGLRLPLLNDFHPHNTFFYGDKCVLIYDYEAVSRLWTHTQALSFALHRFTREYIRELEYSSEAMIKKELTEIINDFLENYYDNGNGLEIPNDLSQKISREIKITNMAKFIAVMTYYIKQGVSSTFITEGQLYAELVKLMALLREAKYYESLNIKIPHASK